MNKEIILPISELKQALAGLGKVIAKGRSLPVLQSVRITRDHEGTVKMHATDLDSFISFTVDGKQPGSFTDVVIPSEHLTKATKGSSPNESITITPEDKSKARI